MQNELPRDKSSPTTLLFFMIDILFKSFAVISLFSTKPEALSYYTIHSIRYPSTILKPFLEIFKDEIK